MHHCSPIVPRTYHEKILEQKDNFSLEGSIGSTTNIDD